MVETRQLSKSTLFDISLNFKRINKNKVLEMEEIKNENDKKNSNGGFIMDNDIRMFVKLKAGICKICIKSYKDFYFDIKKRIHKTYILNQYKGKSVRKSEIP